VRSRATSRGNSNCSFIWFNEVPTPRRLFNRAALRAHKAVIWQQKKRRGGRSTPTRRGQGHRKSGERTGQTPWESMSKRGDFARAFPRFTLHIVLPLSELLQTLSWPESPNKPLSGCALPLKSEALFNGVKYFRGLGNYLPREEDFRPSARKVSSTGVSLGDFDRLFFQLVREDGEEVFGLHHVKKPLRENPSRHPPRGNRQPRKPAGVHDHTMSRLHDSHGDPSLTEPPSGLSVVYRGFVGNSPSRVRCGLTKQPGRNAILARRQPLKGEGRTGCSGPPFDVRAAPQKSKGTTQTTPASGTGKAKSVDRRSVSRQKRADPACTPDRPRLPDGYLISPSRAFTSIRS